MHPALEAGYYENSRMKAQAVCGFPVRSPGPAPLPTSGATRWLAAARVPAPGMVERQARCLT